MTPTNKLRWIGRVTTAYANGVEFHSDNKVLQQWWEHTEWNAEGEWRDVPVEVKHDTRSITHGA